MVKYPRVLLGALACALLFLLLLASANAGAPRDQHALLFLRFGALIFGVFFLAVAVGVYLVGRGGISRYVGIALPVLWIGALYFAFEATIMPFAWLL